MLCNYRTKGKEGGREKEGKREETAAGRVHGPPFPPQPLIPALPFAPAFLRDSCIASSSQFFHGAEWTFISSAKCLIALLNPKKLGPGLPFGRQGALSGRDRAGNRDGLRHDRAGAEERAAGAGPRWSWHQRGRNKLRIASEAATAQKAADAVG